VEHFTVGFGVDTGHLTVGFLVGLLVTSRLVGCLVGPLVTSHLVGFDVHFLVGPLVGFLEQFLVGRLEKGFLVKGLLVMGVLVEGFRTGARDELGLFTTPALVRIVNAKRTVIVKRDEDIMVMRGALMTFVLIICEDVWVWERWDYNRIRQ
jgi:hypothetical protein